MAIETGAEPKIAVGLDIKLNLGNYESMAGSIMVSGLTADSTEAEIQELMETGDLAFYMISRRLTEKLDKARAKRRNGREGEA